MSYLGLQTYLIFYILPLNGCKTYYTSYFKKESRKSKSDNRTYQNMSGIVLQSPESVTFKLASDNELIRDELELTANYNVVVSTDINLAFADIEVGDYFISDPGQAESGTATTHLASYTSQSQPEDWHEALQVVKKWDGPNTDSSIPPGWSQNVSNVSVGQTGGASVTLQAQLMFILRKLLYPYGAPSVVEDTGPTPAPALSQTANLLDTGKVQAWIDESTDTYNLELAITESSPFGSQLFTVAHMQSFIENMITNGRMFFNQIDNVAHIDVEQGDLLRIHVTLADSDQARRVTFNFNLRHHFTAPTWRSSREVSISSDTEADEWSHQCLAKGALPNTEQDANNGVSFEKVPDSQLASGYDDQQELFIIDSNGVVKWDLTKTESTISAGHSNGAYNLQVRATANGSSTDQVITFYLTSLSDDTPSQIDVAYSDQSDWEYPISPTVSGTYEYRLLRGAEHVTFDSGKLSLLKTDHPSSTQIGFTYRGTDTDGSFWDTESTLVVT